MASFFTISTTMFHLLMFVTLAARDLARLQDRKLKNKTLDRFSKTTPDIVLTSKGFLDLFLHFAVVMSSFTQFAFCLLFYIDCEMILPDRLGLSSFLNHMLHTFPLFPNTREERYCKTVAKAGLQFIAFIGFAYLTWIEIKGVWPYPFMFSFSRVEYVMFSVCSFLLSFMLCYICSLVEIRIKNIKLNVLGILFVSIILFIHFVCWSVRTFIRLLICQSTLFYVLYWNPVIGDFISACVVVPAIVCNICLSVCKFCRLIIYVIVMYGESCIIK